MEVIDLSGKYSNVVFNVEFSFPSYYYYFLLLCIVTCNLSQLVYLLIILIYGIDILLSLYSCLTFLCCRLRSWIKL